MKKTNNSRTATKVKSGATTALKVLKRVCLAVTLVLCVVLIVCGYGGHVDPRISAKPSLFTLALPYAAMGMGALALLWLLLRQWVAAVSVIAAIAIVWPSVKVVCPLHLFPEKVKSDEELLQFKVMSFNAQYFIYDEQEYWHNDNKAFDYLLASNADLILVQEGNTGEYLEQMPSVHDRYHELKSKYPYRTKGTRRELSMLSRYPFTDLGRDVSPDSSVYANYYKMEIKGRELYVVNLHLQSLHLSSEDKELYMQYTNPDGVGGKIKNAHRLKTDVLSKLQKAFRLRADQVDMVRARLNDFGENVLLCGDFNDTPCSYAYRTVRGNDLRDAYEDCGFGPEITYHKNRFLFRIDHIMYRGDLHAVGIVRPEVKISDHYPLIATFAWHSREL